MEQLLSINQDINDVKKDVAVLETEVQNFKKVMDRLDQAITAISRVSSNVERLLIVHEERIKNNDLNLTAHKGVVDDSFTSVKARLLKLEEAMNAMNKWRWQIIGAWSVIAFITMVGGKALGLL